MEEGTLSQGIEVALEAGKGKETRSLAEPPEAANPAAPLTAR